MTAFKDFNNNYIMDDDIILHEKDVKELITNDFAKNSKTSEWETVQEVTVNLWPTSQLSYRIDLSIPNSQKQLILQSVAEWNNKTNIKFSETSSNENVYFRKVNSRCKGSLGYSGSNQKNTVNLSETCDKQSIIHEIGHVMGMIHEHQRENRNNYITLKPDTFLHIKNNYSSSLDTHRINFFVRLFVSPR